MKIYYSLIILLILQQINCELEGHMTAEEIEKEISSKIITYGSTVRIEHWKTGFFLHSHDLKYGTGSQQQSVTGFEKSNDYNSLWTIKEAHNTEYKHYSQPVRCGEIIRLEHALTKRNLHSHVVRSPISGRREVSANGNDGDGDENDDWVIICEKLANNEVLKGNNVFNLKHKLTGFFLFARAENSYNSQNCGHQCPIMNQLEICADEYKGRLTLWKIHSGLFYEKNRIDEMNSREQVINNEVTDEDDDRSDL